MIGKKKAIILVVIALAVVGGLFATGHLTRDSAEQLGRRAYYQGRGAVGDVVDTVTSVGPSGTGDPAKAAQCRDNLRRIETAKRAAGNAMGTAIGDIPMDQLTRALGGPLPSCPDGGRYRPNALNTLPTCSIGAGSASDANDDHFILGF
jgi:hypothetical protein